MSLAGSDSAVSLTKSRHACRMQLQLATCVSDARALPPHSRRGGSGGALELQLAATQLKIEGGGAQAARPPLLCCSRLGGAAGPGGRGGGAGRVGVGSIGGWNNRGL